MWETVRRMKAMNQIEDSGVASRELETLMLSDHHLDYLERLCQTLNPQMPSPFGWPHPIRAILDRIEESGIDLTDASSEEEIALLAAGRLRGEKRRQRSSGPLSSSPLPYRRADRPAYRSS